MQKYGNTYKNVFFKIYPDCLQVKTCVKFQNYKPQGRRRRWGCPLKGRKDQFLHNLNCSRTAIMFMVRVKLQ
jgi:hypothetical protein